jgi:hypothetical protein
VYLDGELLDKTPYISKTMKPGEYLIQIQPEETKLVPYSTKITLRSGILTVVTWKPGATPETSGGVIYEAEKLRSGKGTQLSFVTIPDGGIIQINGQNRGFAPHTFEDLLPGEHEYQVTLPSFETQQHSIHLQEGYRMYITLKLAKQASNDTTQLPLDDSSSVSTPKPAATSSAQVKQSAVVRVLPTGFKRNGKEGLRVRKEPNSLSPEIDFVMVGDTLPLLETNTQGWHKVQLEGGVGWVSGSFTEVVKL